MKISDVMTRGVEVVHPEATLQEAAQKMRDIDVGPLPVCDGDRLVGLVTDRDIIVRATAEGRDPRATVVREAMTQGVEYCFEDQDVKEAARLMKDRQIRRVVVLNRDKRLVGILALGDLAEEKGDKFAGDILDGVSAPAKPRGRVQEV